MPYKAQLRALARSRPRIACAALVMLLTTCGVAKAQIMGGLSVENLPDYVFWSAERADSLEQQRDFAPQTAYGDTGPRPAQWTELGAWRVWDAVFAGRSDLAGNSRAGTQGVDASLFGTAIGADKTFDDQGLAGGSISIDQQSFSSGPGRGRSHDVTLTAYGRHKFFDQAYVIGSFSYGWHNIDTSRIVSGFANDPLTASYQARDIGGRIESGYSFTLADIGVVSPYAAIVGDAFRQPAYGETGRADFAAIFSAKTMDLGHIELGSRYARIFALDGDQSLSLDAVMAWEYEMDNNPYILAAFQTAPDTKFPVYGADPAKSTASMGTGVRFKAGDFTFGARGDARLGAGTTIFSGTADLTFQW
jgi:uncharacterized protein with beta-barrel porin domain